MIAPIWPRLGQNLKRVGLTPGSLELPAIPHGNAAAVSQILQGSLSTHREVLIRQGDGQLVLDPIAHCKEKV